jgi:CubicO group peptidase (beta-lactamase class C family)
MKNKIQRFPILITILSTILLNSCITKKVNVVHKIDSYLEKGIANGFNGAILIKQNGNIIINKGYGMTNKKTNTQNNSKTIFDIGSNTKQFTGAAILKLVEHNKLKVSDSIHFFFEDLPADKQNITIHQLLTHTGGFQESIASDFEKTTTEQFFTDVFNSKLYKVPGTQFNYSNIGYSILARIIELASQTEYEQFLINNLFIPAGMKQTGYLLPDWKEENLAIGYNRDIMEAGSTVNRYKEDNKVSWHLKGNGGINSTQEDMLLWYEAIKSEKILSAQSIKKWITPYSAELDDNKHYYGYGWGLRKSENNEFMVSHNGGNGAYSHTIMWKPNEDFAIIYATNTSSPKVENLAWVVEKMLFEPEYTPKEIKKNPYLFVMDFVKSNSIKEAKTLKGLIVKDYKEEFSSPEVLNRLGYMILNSEENLDWSIELFKMNTVLFPEDGNAWDSLGEAFTKAGQKENAIKSFKKAVELGNLDSENKLKSLIM